MNTLKMEQWSEQYENYTNPFTQFATAHKRFFCSHRSPLSYNDITHIYTYIRWWASKGIFEEEAERRRVQNKIVLYT